MGPSECMHHCVGLTTSTPAALRPSTRCSAHIPARYTSALRGSRPAPCMACRRMAAISSSDGSVTLGARVGWPGERPGTYYPARVENGVMRCIECDAADVSERRERTTQGYRRFRCRACGRQFNERSGGILNRAHYPSDVIALVIFWRLRYKLSLRDLPEMFLIRGIEFSYDAVRDWEAKLTPTLRWQPRCGRRTDRAGTP